MDLDEMLHVDRCRDMDELINFWARSDYSPDAGTRLLSPLSYKRWYAEFYAWKIRRIRIGRCSDAWFYKGFIRWASELSKHLCRRYMRSTECLSSSLSRWNTFVGGKCALSSALLVCYANNCCGMGVECDVELWMTDCAGSSEDRAPRSAETHPRSAPLPHLPSRRRRQVGDTTAIWRNLPRLWRHRRQQPWPSSSLRRHARRVVDLLSCCVDRGLAQGFQTMFERRRI